MSWALLLALLGSLAPHNIRIRFWGVGQTSGKAKSTPFRPSRAIICHARINKLSKLERRSVGIAQRTIRRSIDSCMANALGSYVFFPEIGLPLVALRALALQGSIKGSLRLPPPGA